MFDPGSRVVASLKRLRGTFVSRVFGSVFRTVNISVVSLGLAMAC